MKPHISLSFYQLLGAKKKIKIIHIDDHEQKEVNTLFGAPFLVTTNQGAK